jgi:predicted nucleotidyltransferase
MGLSRGGHSPVAALSDILSVREEILRIAAEHGAHNVRIFGSVARGESGDGSDLDVLVRLDDDRSLLDRVALKQDLEDLLGCRVDVVTEGALHRLLRDRILAEAKLL